MRFLSINDLHWVAGFLEGEGCFTPMKNKNGSRSSPRIDCGQVQKEPLERLIKYLGGRLYFEISKSRGKYGGRPLWRWVVQGARATGIMMTLFPLLSPKRQERIRSVLAGWKEGRGRNWDYFAVKAFNERRQDKEEYIPKKKL